VEVEMPDAENPEEEMFDWLSSNLEGGTITVNNRPPSDNNLVDPNKEGQMTTLSQSETTTRLPDLRVIC